MRWTVTILVIIITMSLVQEDNGAALAPPIKKLRKAMKVGQTVNLPAPAVVGGTSLTEALADRRSIRSYTNQILTSLEISQLLWASQGETSGYMRTAPSAGALYPLELYLVTASNIDDDGNLIGALFNTVVVFLRRAPDNVYDPVTIIQVPIMTSCGPAFATLDFRQNP